MGPKSPGWILNSIRPPAAQARSHTAEAPRLDSRN